MKAEELGGKRIEDSGKLESHPVCARYIHGVGRVMVRGGKPTTTFGGSRSGEKGELQVIKERSKQGRPATKKPQSSTDKPQDAMQVN
jgi:hypothetical protein